MANKSHPVGLSMPLSCFANSGVKQREYPKDRWLTTDTASRALESDAESQIAISQVTMPANLGKGVAEAIACKSAGRFCFTLRDLQVKDLVVSSIRLQERKK